MTRHQESALIEARLWMDRAKAAPDNFSAKSCLDSAKQILEKAGLTLVDLEKRVAGKKAVLVVLVDESGSMNSHRFETIQAVNTLIQTHQKELSGVDTRFTLMTFDQYGIMPPVRTITEGSLLGAGLLSHNNYIPRGNTPLYDAIGEAILKAEALSTEGARVVIAIQTDGMENCSRQFTRPAIKRMISEREEKGWKFIFMGADLGSETYAMAADLGIKAERTSSFRKADIGVAYASTAMSSSAFLAGNAADLTYTAQQRAAMGDVWAPPTPAPAAVVERCASPPADTSAPCDSGSAGGGGSE